MNYTNLRMFFVCRNQKIAMQNCAFKGQLVFQEIVHFRSMFVQIYQLPLPLLTKSLN